MDQPLRLLIVEDCPADAELLVRELRRAGFAPAWQRVDTEPEYLARLAEEPELVISDYEMPQFNGLRALELLRASGRLIPFIIVSGTIGEETAVAAIKQGATDYLLKDRLTRLGMAVTHALAEGRHRRERQIAAAALSASEERFRELAETIHEVFWISSPDRARMLYISPAYEAIWGRTCASLYADPHTWSEAIRPEDRERVVQAANSQEALGTYDEEFRIIRPDGTERWIRARAFPVRGDQGEIRRIVGVAEDITKAKELQEQFLRAQRMEAIGALAGGIAHDLNNILAPIVMGVEMLLTRASNEADREMLRLIQHSGLRGSGVIRQLLTFSRGVGGERISVQVRELLDEMITIMRETFPRDLVLEQEAARDLRPVIGDPTQLHQVLMNLCVNARDAMPDGGRLSLTAHNVELGPAEVQAHPPTRPGPYVTVRVADTGHGIPLDLVGRIFEPFFTTKPLSKGTGLGLSTALGIIRSHGGFITVVSTPGHGTTFTVHLPAAPGAAPESTAEEPDDLPRGQGELILVVDDEEPVRTVTQLMLVTHGYRVLTARDGEDALASYVQYRGEVRLVLTDVMMPVMNGVTLIRALLALDPTLRIIATSGLTDQANYVELCAAGATCIIAKPLGARELLETVRAQFLPAG